MGGVPGRQCSPWDLQIRGEGLPTLPTPLPWDRAWWCHGKDPAEPGLSGLALAPRFCVCALGPVAVALGAPVSLSWALLGLC